MCHLSGLWILRLLMLFVIRCHNGRLASSCGLRSKFPLLVRFFLAKSQILFKIQLAYHCVVFEKAIILEAIFLN